MSGHMKPVRYVDWGHLDYLDGAQMRGCVERGKKGSAEIVAYADPDDGKRIVHALNNHDALLDALRALVQAVSASNAVTQDMPLIVEMARDKARAVIAKAEGR